LPHARIGHRYDAVISAALGTTPYRWRVSGGHLPRGLRLTRNGVIIGRPRHRGLFGVRITVRDDTRPQMRAARWFGLRVL
jgi:hypothetical protein